MAEYQITILKFCEHLCPGPLLYYLSHFDEWLNIYFYMWVVRGDNKTILVDTGIRDVKEANPAVESALGKKSRFRMKKEENIPGLLVKAGVYPSEVDYVILTHLHYDHCSNVSLFPKATFVVSRRGWVNTLAARYPYLISGFFPRDVFAFLIKDAADRLYLAEDKEEIIPGVEVFWTGGHTMCSQAVKINTRLGRVVITGDFVYLYDNIEQNHPIGSNYSLTECLDAMSMIKKSADIIIPSHDPKLLEQFPGNKIG